MLAACQSRDQSAQIPSNYDPQATEVAFAGVDAVADTEVLDSARGGFMVFNGIEFDLTFELTTTLGQIDAITSVLTLDDILAGRAGLVTTASGTTRADAGNVVIAGTDGVTEVIHLANPLDGVQAVINNSASGAEIMTVANATMNVFIPQTPRVGQDLPVGGRSVVGPELRQSIIASMPR